MSYHLRKIPKGVFGTWSKVEEELAEYEDAKEQQCKIMMACELSDAWGALFAVPFVKEDTKWYQALLYIASEADKLGLRTTDLHTFAEITSRAFESGARK